MPSLQVRDFPVDLYDELKALAKQEHRSISQQAIVAIREYIVEGASEASRRPKNDEIDYITKRKKLFAEIHALPKPELPPDFPSPVEILREIREERDARW